MKDELVARLDLIVSELQGLPHVVQTCKEAAQALRSRPSVEAIEGVLTMYLDPDVVKNVNGFWEAKINGMTEAARQITALYEEKGG